MLKRVATMGSVVILIVLLPGCPGYSQYVGTWTLTANAATHGLILNANGSASSFMLDATLTGDLSWEAQGDVLTIHRDTGTDLIIYVGRLVGDTVTGGWVIWAGPGRGVGGDWSAFKQ